METVEFKLEADAKKRSLKVIEALGKDMKPRPPTARDPFMVLVATVLSQNTNWRNTGRAFENFKARFKNSAQLANSDIRTLEKLIRPAGLYKSKARNLRKAARMIQEKYNGDLRKVLKKPPAEARAELMELPGTGPKTADCVLLFAGRRKVLPVDVHIARTAKRLGFSPLKGNRERVKRDLESLIPPDKRWAGHLLLIELGRKYCRPTNPSCSECTVAKLCPRIGLD